MESGRQSPRRSEPMPGPAVIRRIARKGGGTKHSALTTSGHVVMPSVAASGALSGGTAGGSGSAPATKAIPKKASAARSTSTVGKPQAPAKPVTKTSPRVAVSNRAAAKDAAPGLTRRGPLPGVGSTLGGLLQLDVDSSGHEAGNAPTQRQMEIYAFIRDKIHSRGFGPTVREIGQAFRIRSPNGVVCHLKALERKRLITRGRNMSRAIELVAEPAHLKGLPMAGWVAAGSLRVAEEQQERIDFQELFDRDDHFVLKVMGDSMIEAQISDGDWVVIRRQKTARAGDIVVAQTDDGEATLKQWFPERDRIRLQPANASMKPIYVKNARVLGVLVGVVRKTT